MVIAVLVKVDNGGTATILCSEMAPDPLFPEKVILKGIVGLTWPTAGKFMKVTQWSVMKDAVLNWMIGPLRDSFDMDMEMLTKGGKDIPLPPGHDPHQDLVNHPEEVAKLVQPDAPKAAPAPVLEPVTVTPAPVSKPPVAPATAPKTPRTRKK